jgi:DNA helicase-2/ATP-dependent DNA helicase PcrA
VTAVALAVECAECGQLGGNCECDPEDAAPVKPARIWSPQQSAVFDAVADSEPDAPHLVVEALAGTGKTTTIVEALRHVRQGPTLMVAFNKAIAEELAERVPGSVQVMTLHSFGLRAITRAHGRRPIDGDATRKRIEGICGSEWHGREGRTAVARLVSVAKGCLLDADPDTLDRAADEAEIAFPDDDAWPRERIIKAACVVLEETLEQTEGPLDFDDMIWLPIAQNLKIPQFRWVFVDETQDLNPAQLETVVRAAGGSGRICAIGDRRQAIYGFRGADVRAIPRMIERLQAEVLPLSVTYRCPVAVVRQAQRLVPTIEAAPGAPDGIVRDATFEAMRRDAKPGDFVISRVNAPLVSECLKWISQGVRATIRGREIGAGLATWVKGTKADGIPELSVALDAWEKRETARLTKLGRDTQAVADRAACLHVLCESCATVRELLDKIERLFADKGAPGIQLMSTHKSKGLEADRVWLLRDTYCKWPGAEEENLLYVGITRSKRELVYVREQKL